ncbi:MAG: NIPSNAP family protein [Alphaproteobacteria bacterium]|nr:NIPSNAP family protein [Alphaproteobacteria bacterium]
MTKYVEMRTYTLLPGKVPDYFKLYEAKGLPVQTKYLKKLVGYYATEIGPLNQVVHMWGYDSLDERADCRARMTADPDWQAYVGEQRKNFVTMESKMLVPAPFFKVK